ncbi:MAG TPA: radical SAM protein [Candidatus Binatia bacterium]|nr:radical SAM protein [Candidatus Binatia bacterium]
MALDVPRIDRSASPADARLGAGGMTAIDIERSPVVAIWEVTRACDLACRHCRACAVVERSPRELTGAEAFDLIEQVAELAPGVLVLTGGDPLKRDDIFEIVARAASRGLRVAVAPSVTPLLTADAIARLAAAGAVRIALSIDAPDAVGHDSFRGTPGSFARTLAATAAVRSAGLSLQINTSLTRASAPRLEELGGLVRRIAPELWSVFFVVAVGRARAADEPAAETCEEAFHFLREFGERTGIAVKTTAAPAYRRVLAEAARGRAAGLAKLRLPPPVTDGRGFVFVSHEGEVQPSGFLPIRAGNVRERRLAEIYRDHPLFRALRDRTRLEGKCGACRYNAICGGSRARAFAATGNPLAADPACAYQPPGYTPAAA